MTVIDIKNEIFMLQNLWAACSNVFGVVKSLLIAKYKKERKETWLSDFSYWSQTRKEVERNNKTIQCFFCETWKNVHLVG